jgi:hypothetical protein
LWSQAAPQWYEHHGDNGMNFKIESSPDSENAWAFFMEADDLRA